MASINFRNGKATVKITSNTAIYNGELKRQLQNAVSRGVYLVHGTVQDNLSNTGQRSPVWDNSIPRLYWNATERTYTQASVPGTPPNKQRGSLRNRMAIEWGSERLSAKVGARDSLVYARVHELGSARMPKRPYLRPAFEEHVKMIQKSFSYAIKKSGAII